MEKLIGIACVIPVLVSCGMGGSEVKTHEWEFCIENGWAPTVLTIDTIKVYPKTSGCDSIGEFEEGETLEYMTMIIAEKNEGRIFLVADKSDTVFLDFDFSKDQTVIDSITLNP